MDPWDLCDPVDILSKLPENFQTELESKKWLDRKTVLDTLLQLITDNPRLCPKAHYAELVETLKRVLEKDSNINVASVSAKCLTGLAKGLRQKFGMHASTLAPVIFEKFKEKKPTLREPLIECIDAVYATTQLESFAEDIIAATAKPNPQIRIQLYAFLYRVFRSLKTAAVPKKFLKDLLPALIKHTTDPDPEVRDAACSVLGAIMKCIGQKAAAIMFNDIASDKVKMAKIEEFHNKALEEFKQEEALLAESAPKAPAQKEAAGVELTLLNSESSGSSAARQPAVVQEAQIDPWDMFDPVDILPKIADNFKTELDSKKWLERKTALEVLLQLLTDNPRLCPKSHYGDLVETLKRVLEKDSNILVCSIAAKCLTGLATGLRTKFGVHAQTLTSVIFEKFKEKKPSLRDPLIELIDAVYATTQLENLAEDIMTASSKPNPNIKIQLDLFLYRVFKQLKPAAVPKKFMKELVPVLIKHTTDPDPEVRDASCSALGAIMKCIGQKPALILFSDIAADKIKMAKIEEFYNNAINEAGQEIVSAMVQSIHKPDVPPAVVPKVAKKEEPKLASRPPSAVGANSEAEDANGEPLKLARGGGEDSEGDGSSTNRTANKKPAKRDRSSSQMKQPKEDKPEEPEALLLAGTSNDRTTRAKEEKSLKLLKWNFDMPTAEHIQQLNGQLTEVSKLPLTSQLLSKDFKHHLKAIDYLQEMLNSDALPIINNIDLLLKWSTLRFFDTNPAVLIKVLEFLCATFAHMDANSENLNDSEMLAFLPYLLLKSGDTKDVIRSNVRKIVNYMGGISVPSKIFPLVLDGLKTKNSRQKAECTMIADSFLELMGINITQTPQVTMKALAGCISDRDSQVRNAALNAIVTVYKKIGDRVYSLIGQLNEKEKAMLDERIKRSGRSNGGPDSEQRPATVRESSATRMNTTFSTPVRARSSSGTRQLNTTLQNTTLGASDLPPVPTKTRHSMGSSMVPSNSKFQLDAKFFNDDFEDANFNGTAKFDNNNVDIMDLKPIQPLVRPVSSFTKRSESVSSISSLESAEHIDRTVHNLSCLSLNIADEAIAQLLHLLHDPTNKAYIVDRTEIILKTFVTQFFHIRSQHLEHLDENTGENELSEFMRSVCNFLSTLVKDDLIVKKISADTMRSFVDAILSLVTGEKCTGGKKSKERVTVLVGANMSGTEKLTLLVIKRSNNPRCFKNAEVPVDYTANAKAWMTGAAFEDWLKTWDKRLKKDGRKVLLYVDNCSAHPSNVTLNNIILKFFPPNTTAMSQPMDQGIIQNLKVHYRRFMLRERIKDIDEKKDIMINLLNALHILRRAWTEVNTDTISNCFRHAKFVINTEVEEVDDEQGDGGDGIDELLEAWSKFQLRGGMNNEGEMWDFVLMDNDVVTDPRLTNLAGSRQIFRSLNVVVIRICEFSNPNNCFIALMKLLIKYQTNEPDGKIISLIRKCLFKHVDVFLDPGKYEQLDLHAVFDLLHEYFSKFYVGEPVPESVKETCRTLNVYIQRLVVTKRYKVLNFLYPYPENGQLVSYVRRCVRALGKSDQAKAANEEQSQTQTDPGQAPVIQKTVPEELVQLFRRVSDDIFDGCVEELYNFMDVHPEQNGNFEELMSSCEYSCIVRRAFSEIRRSRIKKEPLGVGDSVRQVLPQEDRDFIAKQLSLQKKIDDAVAIYNSSNPIRTNGSPLKIK